MQISKISFLKKIQNEKCIKPFIDACDLDQNSVTDSREWCRCFEKTERPCAAVKRRLNSDMMSSYSPDCDSQGFYKSTQCHHVVGVCWCVDKHGVEFANTRTRNNKPNCGKFFIIMMVTYHCFNLLIKHNNKLVVFFFMSI